MPFHKDVYEAPFGRDLDKYTLEEISDLAIALSVAAKHGAIKIDNLLKDADELKDLKEKDRESKNLLAQASKEAEDKNKEQIKILMQERVHRRRSASMGKKQLPPNKQETSIEILKTKLKRNREQEYIRQYLNSQRLMLDNCIDSYYIYGTKAKDIAV